MWNPLSISYVACLVVLDVFFDADVCRSSLEDGGRVAAASRLAVPGAELRAVAAVGYKPTVLRY